MKNVIHGVDFGVCQWTGEAINKRFKIPKPNTTHPMPEWVGCYGSPSVAVSALTQLAQDLKLVPDKANELIDHFQDSLRRTVGHENDAFTIQPAPSWKNLTNFGGLTPLKEFHETYDHDFQIKAFEQVVPNNTVPVGDNGEKAPLKQWSYTKVPEDRNSEMASGPIQVPRCLASWMDFLSSNNSWRSVSPNAVVLYFHPTNDKLMAIGCPASWNESSNKRAAEMFGKTPVYGDVMIIHKNKLKEMKKNDEAKDGEEGKRKKRKRSC